MLLIRRSIGIVLTVFAGLLVGCQKQPKVVDGPPLYPVQGEIRIDGEIPVGATIRFSSPATAKWGRMPMAVVQPNGVFVASFAAKDDGMPAGEYDVFVYWMEVPPEGGLPIDRLNGKFVDTSRPVTKVFVREGENHLERLELSTGGL